MYPIYQDFGKSTKDFFAKGFKTGNFTFNCKSNPSKYIKATIAGAHNIEKMEANGDFEYQLTCPILPGFTSTAKWSTLKTVKQEFSFKDLLACGLTMGWEGTFDMDKSTVEGRLKPVYRHPKVTFDGFFAAGEKTTFGTSLVSGYKNFAGGMQLEVDPDDPNVITKSNVAAAYVCGPYSFFTSLDNADILWGGLIYRYDPSLEFGVTGNYKAEPEGVAVFGACMKYVMDCCTAFKLKLDSNLQLGLGFETKIRPNASITMSTNIDGNKINTGGHTVGLSVDLDC